MLTNTTRALTKFSRKGPPTSFIASIHDPACRQTRPGACVVFLPDKRICPHRKNPTAGVEPPPFSGATPPGFPTQNQ
jgi:hypothetical protein